MIKNITIKDTASYNNIVGVKFAPTLVNFIYGSNGSGKTTISNVIEDCSAYPNCKIDWGLTPPLKTLVYNRNFIERNFEQISELKGIFTLGKESKEEIEKIKTKKVEIEKRDEIIVGYKKTLEQQNESQQSTENIFIDKCWAVQKKYETVFIKAFEGNRNSKVRYKEKVVSEFVANKQPVVAFTELENKANAILNAEAVKAPEINEFVIPDFKSFEEHTIFQTRIIGKDDVDIAKMIMKLNNSDWVRQGISYYNVNNDICPFCQQTTDESFKKQLDEYFDETYNKQIETLKSANEKYIFECDILLTSISNYIELNHPFLDLIILNSLKELISSKYQKNLLELEKKQKEPTVKIELDSISEHLTKLKEIIDAAILKTKEHNKLVENIVTEKRQLISKIWAFVISELKNEYDGYIKECDAYDKATKSINAKIKTTEEEIKALKLDIQESENKITSIQPTIDAINKTLSGFGFTNFQLKETTTPGNYKIIRENGIDAKNTLSEGEKNFITFLYFYHLINGSFETKSITIDKVIVIDDPISSLDSSILFVVSNLVRRLISDCIENKSNIKQIFILTHNVYFHKEVTFKKRSESNKGESFWINRKVANNSKIEKHDVNPVKTTYDLLWQEIRIKDKINSLTVFNTLRRILEYYFKILGKIKDDKLLNKFEGEEKVLCNALLSWINDGSHSIDDDIFVSNDSETIEKYLNVFKRIFENENQIEHYKMMMKLES